MGTSQQLFGFQTTRQLTGHGRRGVDDMDARACHRFDGLAQKWVVRTPQGQHIGILVEQGLHQLAHRLQGLGVVPFTTLHPFHPAGAGLG